MMNTEPALGAFHSMRAAKATIAATSKRMAQTYHAA